MTDPLANAQLELACRVGSRDAIVEAIEEGADINFGGQLTLILAIMARDRSTVSILVGLGADTASLGIKSIEHEAIVDELMLSAPSEESPPEEDPVDAKLVRAFDRMIRNQDLGEPFRKNRGGEYSTFCEGLRWIAAEDCHSVITEFLALMDPIRASDGDAGVTTYLADNGTQVSALTERYVAVTEIPGDLLKEYLKERKKLTK